MLENKYDDESFFRKYSQMDRSQNGLASAGEWSTLAKLLPDFTGKKLLDLGCGFGWHCRYAVEHGAAAAVGIDISQKMLAVARSKTDSDKITYLCQPIEKLDFPPQSFDIVLSSLALHYVNDFDALCAQASCCLKAGGEFIFSVEHPIFTAAGAQQWHYDPDGTISHWPVDNYFNEGQRTAIFLGEQITKYHKTLTTYLNTLLQNSFSLRQVVEPQPSLELLSTIPAMGDELRRPMMLIVAAQKQN